MKFSLAALTVKFILSNVAYRLTVYKTGVLLVKKRAIIVWTIKHMLLFYYYTTLHFTAALPAIQQLGLWVGSNNIYISSASMSYFCNSQSKHSNLVSFCSKSGCLIFFWNKWKVIVLQISLIFWQSWQSCCISYSRSNYRIARFKSHCIAAQKQFSVH